MAEMTAAQAAIAVPILNSYAHQYLGLSPNDILISGGRKGERWRLLVAHGDGIVTEVADLDAAKQIVDGVYYHGG